MTKGLRHLRPARLGQTLVVLGAVAAAAAAFTAGTANSFASCPNPYLQPFRAWGDTAQYLPTSGGNFESGLTGWTVTGRAAAVPGNESFYVGSQSDSHSLALPTTSSSVTTPTMCVTSDAPLLRLFIRNSGLNGYTDGQLAFYLNFTGPDGKLHQVKIAGLKGSKTAWAPSPQITFLQYITTQLQSGTAQISFTIKPNDTHGNWQIDDLYIDPLKHA